MVRFSLRTSLALFFLALAPWQALAQQTAYPQPPPPEEDSPAYPPPAAPPTGSVRPENR